MVTLKHEDEITKNNDKIREKKNNDQELSISKQCVINAYEGNDIAWTKNVILATSTLLYFNTLFAKLKIE